MAGARLSGWSRLPARNEPEVPPHRRPPPALDGADQRRTPAVEDLADRQLGSLVGVLDGEHAAVTQAEPEDAADIAASARAVHVLDPQLHASDVLLEAPEREEEMPLAELAESRMDDEVTGSELELHPPGTGRRVRASRGKTAGFTRSGR